MLATATPTILGFTARKMSQQLRDCVGRDTEAPNYVGSEGLGPSNPNQQKDTPFKILPILYANAKMRLKSH